MAARRNEEPSRQPMPQPEYPAIATFVDKAEKADIDALFDALKNGLTTMKGPKADQARKVTKAIERTEELMSHLLQVREKIASERKGKR
ncbi:MAG: hypothetical protein JNJ54_02490 [Myxococcaceae bacterium]|nr:hypothetical protein [Myxococcaceae bacterium]